MLQALEPARPAAMNFLIPPSREHVKANLRLLAADWGQGNALMRYFVVSLVAGGVVSLACSAASLLSLVLDQKIAAIGFVCVAGATLLHAVGTWNLLKRRYQVRFAVF